MFRSKRETENLRVTSTLQGIIRGIISREMIVFCGAGISRNSGLPTVEEFVLYLLNLLEIPKSEQEVLWNFESNTLRLPFEALIEIMQLHSNIAVIFDIFAAGEPNTTHLFLARLMKAAYVKTIVTTNFDGLIEKALDTKPAADYEVLYKGDQFNSIDLSEPKSRLLKIHGSIADRENMAITIKQIARAESVYQRKGPIREIYSTGPHKAVLILGYSCSDAFDISPLIEGIGAEYKNVFYIQHQAVERQLRSEAIGAQPRNNPFKKVSSGTRLFHNTDQFIETLWKRIFQDEYQKITSQTDWRGNLERWCQDAGLIARHLISGRLFLGISNYSLAEAYFEKALFEARKIERKSSESTALGNLGITYRSMGMYRKSIEYHKQALQIARERGDKQGEEVQLGNLGSAHYSVRENRQAIECHEQAIQITRTIADKYGEGCHLGNLGLVRFSMGDYRLAIEHHEQALEIARTIGDKQGEGVRLGNLGNAYHSLGENHQAIGCHEQALEIARAIGDRHGEGCHLGNLGNAYHSLGEYRRAIECHEQALKIAEEIGDKQGEGNRLANIGNAYLRLNKYRRAIKYHERALKIARAIEDKEGEGTRLANLGVVYRRLGKCPKAIDCYDKALAILQPLGEQHPFIKVIQDNRNLALKGIKNP